MLLLIRNMPTDSNTPRQSSHFFAELGLKKKCKKINCYRTYELNRSIKIRK